MTMKPVGQTATAGFQIGVRRTLNMSKEQAWELLTSATGLKLWLGDLETLNLEAGHPYTAYDGTSGEMRVVKPYAQLRMTWQRKDWAKPSTLQIRLLPASGNKTTISFHQEKLADLHAREEMKMRWESVLSRLSDYAG
ncbi:SRPBCC family protein [Paenibacillus sp. UNC451MF]|uniref:SRPBCC family protein n=1 Tax=Paenibacillus sp. UNC451MF TaxID=1449063 RepID=UPI000491D49F|nr:SRPBCC domain-containing protein [Paenibacillus sp. UNC451MF]